MTVDLHIPQGLGRKAAQDRILAGIRLEALEKLALLYPEAFRTLWREALDEASKRGRRQIHWTHR
jgi:hypothetical protein